jgi:hypothetical protein
MGVYFAYYFAYFSKDGIGRYDMGPLYASPEIFGRLVNDVAALHEGTDFDAVIAADSIGSDRNAATEILFERYRLRSIGTNAWRRGPDRGDGDSVISAGGPYYGKHGGICRGPK